MVVAEMKKFERKITQMGNSNGVTIPTEALEHMGVKRGDDVSLYLEKDGRIYLKKNEHLDFEGLEGIDQKFLDGMKQLFNDYDNTLRNLADK